MHLTSRIIVIIPADIFRGHLQGRLLPSKQADDSRDAGMCSTSEMHLVN